MDKDRVLARLAASDVVSLRHQYNLETYAEDYAEAARRVYAAFPDYVQQVPPDSPDEAYPRSAAEIVLDWMIEIIQEGRLTINFVGVNWFNTVFQHGTYANMFEIGRFDQLRDSGEVEMGRYGKWGQAPPQFPGIGQPRVVAAAQRVDRYGPYQRPRRTMWQRATRQRGAPRDFAAAMRPKYAAVDFGFWSNGGVPEKYGKSFLVLKDYLKHNSTYTHADSLTPAREMVGDRPKLEVATATYFTLARVIRYCDDQMLKGLFMYADQAALRGSGPKPARLMGAYIEAQVHSEIRHDRDVAGIYLSYSEVSTGGWRSAGGWGAADRGRILDNARRFSEKHGIRLQLIP